MKTEIIDFKEKIDSIKLKKIGKVIQNNGLVVFPTETVYGLGANGLNPLAVEKIFKAKGRPTDNPMIIHIGEIEQLYDLVEEVSTKGKILIEKFWPGPLTILFKKKSKVPDIVTGGLNTVAIRMPANEIAKEVIKSAGVPLAAPSANTSGRPSPTKVEHAIEDLNGRVDIIIDGGSSNIGLESTVIDLSEENPVILRPGKITLEELKETFPYIEYDKSIDYRDIAPKSPGQKYKHYAPNGEMTLYMGYSKDVVETIKKDYNRLSKEGYRVGILTTDERAPNFPKEVTLSLGSAQKIEEIAKNLFNCLRKFDELKVDFILSEGFYSSKLGKAIMNRMLKASNGRVKYL